MTRKRRCSYCGSTQLRYAKGLVICKKCAHLDEKAKPMVTLLSL